MLFKIHSYLRVMQVFLTFDYELFFGSPTGSVQKCLLEPTRYLREIAKKHAVPMTFFVDIGYIVALQRNCHEFPQLQSDLEAVLNDLNTLQSEGHSLQLHIHPHWEKAFYNGSQWIIQAEGCYKLADFSQEEAASIVRKYYAALRDVVSNPITTFRAGGWCIQPFSLLKDVFKELGISIDTTVFPGGKLESKHYYFDFTTVPPFSDCYRFENDVCTPQKDGFFTEFPIAAWRYSPLFFWQLYGWGRLQPKQHKMMGDGSYIPQPGRKKSGLTSFTWNHVSTDGYFAKLLHQQAKTYANKGVKHFVTIGHPKSNTLYSLRQLERFIARNKSHYQFVAFK